MILRLFLLSVLPALVLTTSAQEFRLIRFHPVMTKTNELAAAIGNWTVVETNAEGILRLQQGEEEVLIRLPSTEASPVFDFIRLDTLERYRMKHGDTLLVSNRTFRVVAPTTNLVTLISISGDRRIAVTPLTRKEHEELRTRALR
jgi:hypothetical protein